jgi:hypothetical protein
MKHVVGASETPETVVGGVEFMVTENARCSGNAPQGSASDDLRWGKGGGRSSQV